MKKIQILVIILVGSISGFLGGILSNYYYPLKILNYSEEKGCPQSMTKVQNIPTTSLSPENPIGSEKKIVEANEFRLVDMEGSCLAKLTFERILNGSDLLRAEDKEIPYYLAVLEMGNSNNTIRITKDGIIINDKFTSQETHISDGFIRLSNKRASILMKLDSYFGNSITIADEEGIARAVLGSIDLKVLSTGEIQKKPESSIVLFGKDGNVVYSAPH